MLIAIRRRMLTALLSIPAMTAHRIGERFETDLVTPLVNACRVFDRQRREFTIVVPVELGAIKLRLALEHTDAISEHGELPCRSFTTPHRFAQQLTALTLEVREADCMLRNQPGGLLTVFADCTRLGPTIGKKLPERTRVGEVHSFHARVVAGKERSVPGEL